jgi:hypothetical protein
MDYIKSYNNIIISAKHRSLPKGGDIVLERHHILPKSCGGNNRKDNLVNLTLREHYISHLLLERIYRETEHHKKMLRAVFMMGCYGNKNSRLYKSAKEAHIKNLRTQTISEEQKKSISDANKGNKSRTGHKNSSEHNRILRESSIGRIPSKETRAIWSKQRKGKTPPNKGTTGGSYPNYPKIRKPRGPHSPESIEKMRLAKIEWHKKQGHNING